MRLNAFVLLLLLISSTLAKSQTDSPDELDKKYSPPAGSHFDGGKSGGSSSGIQSAILLEPTLVPRGVFAATYRRNILRSPVSLSGTLGIMFEKDMIYSLEHEILGSTAESSSDMPLWLIHRDSPLLSGGRFFGQMTVRFSMSNPNSLKGFGMEAGVRFHNFRLDPYVESSEFNFAASNINVKTRTIFVNWSHIFASTKRAKPFTQQLTYGFGYRITTYDEIYLDYDNLAYKKTGALTTFGKLTFMLSYGLGIGW